MAISHELSSEIAIALFANQESKSRSPRELDDLKEMVLQIHSTLEQLSRKPRFSSTDVQPDPSPSTKIFGPVA